MPETQVLIAGAGPTGLVMALSLARHGVPFRIIDRHRGPGEASRAVVVHARTLEFYQQLGFADEVVARGIKLDKIRLREGGIEVASVTFADLGKGISPFPFALCFPQDDHERFLIERLATLGVSVEWETELADFVQDENGVRAVLHHAGTQERAEFAYLCGCDGAHSRVREVLGLGFPGGTYEQMFYVADTRLTEAAGDDLVVSLGTNSLGLVLPVRSSGMHRLIGLVPEQLSGRAELSFEDLRSSVEPLLGVSVAQVNWFSTYRVHHRVAARFRTGRCFIAGDAGHIHSPAGGQGMNTGIGDAVNLSWKLAEVVQGRADASILDTYEPERIAFARQLVASTDRAFEAMVGAKLGSRILRSWLIPHLIPLLWRLSATRRFMFDRVSQVRIAYHDSALSQGKAGGIEGGDRLPWAVEGGRDNFAPLTTLAWQMHVYGTPRAALAEAAASLGLPLHVFPFGAAAKAAGLGRDAAYLVRPDGHVSLVLPDQDATTLTVFVGRHRLRFAHASQSTA